MPLEELDKVCSLMNRQRETEEGYSGSCFATSDPNSPFYGEHKKLGRVYNREERALACNIASERHGKGLSGPDWYSKRMWEDKRRKK